MIHDISLKILLFELDERLLSTEFFELSTSSKILRIEIQSKNRQNFPKIGVSSLANQEQWNQISDYLFLNEKKTWVPHNGAENRLVFPALELS